MSSRSRRSPRPTARRRAGAPRSDFAVLALARFATVLVPWAVAGAEHVDAAGGGQIMIAAGLRVCAHRVRLPAGSDDMPSGDVLPRKGRCGRRVLTRRRYGWQRADGARGFPIREFAAGKRRAGLEPTAPGAGVVPGNSAWHIAQHAAGPPLVRFGMWLPYMLPPTYSWSESVWHAAGGGGGGAFLARSSVRTFFTKSHTFSAAATVARSFVALSGAAWLVVASARQTASTRTIFAIRLADRCNHLCDSRWGWGWWWGMVPWRRVCGGR